MPKTNSTEIQPALSLYDFEQFNLQTLVVESALLRENPLGDSATRRIPLMVPKGQPPERGWPVVLMLSGFTGNGPQMFNIKTFQEPTPAVLERLVNSREAPQAIYAFCDAVTTWGGSQFIDSEGMGAYGSYVASELYSAISTSEPLCATHVPDRWCVMGGSSGGYGALQLASKHPDKFGWAIALAPDCFFEASLLPEIRTALPSIQKMGGVAGVREELRTGKLLKRKDSHVILNAVAMGLCYAPLKNGEPVWPIDPQSGKILPEIWQDWIRHDPIEFLRARIANVMKVKGFYLDAGDRDQFQLQYGTRQVRDLLKSIGANVSYAGFDGNHFDLGERRPAAWAWLAEQWR